LFVLISIF